jgi:uncharacterized phage-associated protein
MARTEDDVEEAPADISKVADWFLNRVDRDAGEAITHLKLQKLLYFSQAWYLANKGKPMFDDDFQAWAHGPVSRKIYEQHRGRNWEPLDRAKKQPKLSADIEKCLVMVFDEYGKYGAKHLEQLTHKHNPWIDARSGLPPEARCETVISKEAMRDFYGAKIGKQW